MAFPKIDIQIPIYREGELTKKGNPYSDPFRRKLKANAINVSIKGLRKEGEGRTIERMPFFEKHTVRVARLNNGFVPWQFETSEKCYATLDSGCVGFLKNRKPQEIELVRKGDKIAGIRPLPLLFDRYPAHELFDAPPFDPFSPPDKRRRATSEQVIREGAEKFREDILRNYRVCAVTGESEACTLQAAHISPYGGKHSNHEKNGILLRADIHLLFDNGKIWFEYTQDGLQVDVRVKQDISRTVVKLIKENAHLNLPNDKSKWPWNECVQAHKAKANKKIE